MFSSIFQICKVIDRSCQHLLNQGFCKVDKYHTLIQKVVKQQLPRRESERRNHPLARHVDILAAIETRLSLLNMTYMKYIDLSLCCFIPGKVISHTPLGWPLSALPCTWDLLAEINICFLPLLVSKIHSCFLFQ